MKKGLIISSFVICAVFFISATLYNPKFVDISTVGYKNSNYTVLWMKRGESNKLVKAKYFASKDTSGKSVPTRYAEWSRGKKIICYTSGTYMSNHNANMASLVGLAIDNGRVVNQTVEKNLDALIIVYATGGVVASNLDDKNLTVQGGSLSGVKLDIRGNAFHRTKFIEWAKENNATVFQTHLLAMDNVLKVFSNGSKNLAERRFLAVGYDENGKLVHAVIHDPNPSTLYDGSKKVLDFLTGYKEMKVSWMINLDTGSQNVFELKNSDGTTNAKIKGKVPVTNARNLLVYYE